MIQLRNFWYIKTIDFKFDWPQKTSKFFIPQGHYVKEYGNSLIKLLNFY